MPLLRKLVDRAVLARMDGSCPESYYCQLHPVLLLLLLLQVLHQVNCLRSVTGVDCLSSDIR